MVTSGTDDKSRTSESNLAGENERAKIESSFLRYVRAYHTNRGRLSLSLSLFHSLRDRSRSFHPVPRIIYASISNLRETVRKITSVHGKPNRIEKQ